MNATDQVFFAVVVFIVVKDIDDFRSSSLVPESPVLLPALIFVEPRRSRLLPGHGQQTVFSLKSFFVGVDGHRGQEREAEAANDSVKMFLSTKKSQFEAKHQQEQQQQQKQKKSSSKAARHEQN